MSLFNSEGNEVTTFYHNVPPGTAFIVIAYVFNAGALAPLTRQREFFA